MLCASEILFRYEAIEYNTQKFTSSAQKLLCFRMMSENGINGNNNLLHIAPPSNESIASKNSVIQTERNFTVDTKSRQTALTRAFDKLDRIIKEKLTPCFKNSWKNFWNRERKKALLETKAALDVLKDSDEKFTIGQLKNNTDRFKTALNNQALSKVSREALEALVKELRDTTGYLKNNLFRNAAERDVSRDYTGQKQLVG